MQDSKSIPAQYRDNLVTYIVVVAAGAYRLFRSGQAWQLELAACKLRYMHSKALVWVLFVATTSPTTNSGKYSAHRHSHEALSAED